MEEVLRWLPVLTLVTQLLLVWVIWSLRQQFVTRTACKVQRRECGQIKDTAVTLASDRIKSLETGIPSLPTRAEFQTLGDKIEKLTEKLGTLDGRLGGINRAVDLLNQHHLNKE